jgi:hypothetical protein
VTEKVEIATLPGAAVTEDGEELMVKSWTTCVSAALVAAAKFVSPP